MYFSKGAPEGVELSFPLEEVPSEECGLHSPCVGENRFDIAAPPTPGSDEFQEELEEVQRVRYEVVSGKVPDTFNESVGLSGLFAKSNYITNPILMAGGIKRLEDCPEAVHMDHPLDLGSFCFEWLESIKAERIDRSGHNAIDFLGRVGVKNELGFYIQRALEETFRLKYYFGRIRPEEILGYNMTGYREGCPPHPSAPSGHFSVAETTRLWINHNYYLDDDQQNVVRQACHGFGNFRVYAGVHFRGDNQASIDLSNALFQHLICSGKVDES